MITLYHHHRSIQKASAARRAAKPINQTQLINPVTAADDCEGHQEEDRQQETMTVVSNEFLPNQLTPAMIRHLEHRANAFQKQQQSPASRLYHEVANYLPIGELVNTRL